MDAKSPVFVAVKLTAAAVAAAAAALFAAFVVASGSLRTDIRSSPAVDEVDEVFGSIDISIDEDTVDATLQGANGFRAMAGAGTVVTVDAVVTAAGAAVAVDVVVATVIAVVGLNG